MMATGSKFDEKYITEWKEKVAPYRAIIIAEAGSHLLGLNGHSSDYDEMGVFIETPKKLIGLSPKDTFEFSSASIRGAKRAEPGDISLVMYGLRKYVTLALGGNPNLLNLLFTPVTKQVISTFWGNELQALAPKIVSKIALKAFLGYLESQRQRLTGVRGQRDVNRPELVSLYGYDTKYAMHMLRLGKQGLELTLTGKLTLPLPNLDREWLLHVRHGGLSMDECLNYAKDIEQRIKDAIPNSPLPDKPDYDAVEEWLINTYINAWKGSSL